MTLLKKQLTDINIDFNNGISVYEAKRWIITYYPDSISLYAINPYYRVFNHYVGS